MPHSSQGFNLLPGRVIAGKYEVVCLLGKGWQGEVYKIREIQTDIHRAAKLFYPERNPGNRTSQTYARKLHKLVECPILIQYHAHETIRHRNAEITVLVSEYVEGSLLSDYLKCFRGNRMPVFQAIHLLHALATGIECIHHLGEYHGDLHVDNVIIRRLGLTYELRLIDLYHWGKATKSNRQHDICDLTRIFYDVLGGQPHYKKLPKPVRDIICGLKRTLILKKFPTVSDLRMHLENSSWG